MQEPTIYEKSISFTNFSDPISNLISSVLIYGTHYYSVSEVNCFVKDFIHHKAIYESNYEKLMNVLNVLNRDLNREIIYGPHGYSTTVGDIPHRDHLNEKFICDLSNQNPSLNLL